jgi:hypothetical protein
MNHPNIDDLMRVEDSVEVEMRGKKRTYYLRTLGQRDEDARRDFAVAASRAMYRALANPESADYLRYMAPLAEMSREAQETNVVSLRQPAARREAEREIVVPDVEEPNEHPTVIDIVENEEARDEAEAVTEKARDERAQETQNGFAGEVKGWDAEKLLAELQQLTRDAVVADAFGRAFNDGSLYWGVWKDAKYKVRAFASTEEAGNCSPGLYNRLLSAYYDLDKFSLDVDALKNSPSGQPQ